VESVLKEVEATARSDRNLMPAILDAVKANAIVGEIPTGCGECSGSIRNRS